MRFVKNFFGVIFSIAAFSYVIIAITKQQPLWLIATTVALVIAVLLLRKTKKDKERYAAKHPPLTKDDFKPVQGSFKHAAGLPVAPGTECKLNLTTDGLFISSSGIDFSVAIDKITSIETKTDTEIQNQTQYVSSAGGALAGAMLFGLPGALVGGRTKKKGTASFTYKNFIVITYKKEDTVAYLLFQTGSISHAVPFIKNFELLNESKSKETISL